MIKRRRREIEMRKKSDRERERTVLDGEGKEGREKY